MHPAYQCHQTLIYSKRSLTTSLGVDKQVNNSTRNNKEEAERKASNSVSWNSMAFRSPSIYQFTLVDVQSTLSCP